MRRRHWFMVPRGPREAVWAAYVSGQEIRKGPTAEWHAAADAAILAVARSEGLA